MATLEEMQKLGYGQPQTGTQQISQMVQGAQDYTQKQETQKTQDLSAQTKLYFELRQQGYSDVDAADRVNRTHMATNFVQKLLTGQDNQFAPGTEPDQIASEQAKAKSDAAAKTAEAAKFNAQAKYYNAGGRNQDVSGMTPNQIQMEIKRQSSLIGMGTPEEDADIKDRVGFLQTQLDTKAGYKKTGNVTDTSAATGKIRVKRKADGQIGTISAAAFDPNKYDKV